MSRMTQSNSTTFFFFKAKRAVTFIHAAYIKQGEIQTLHTGTSRNHTHRNPKTKYIQEYDIDRITITIGRR
jgi:hypothetical protein